MSAFGVAAIAAAATIVGSILTFMSQRRTSSGTIKFTEAPVLWSNMNAQLDRLTLAVSRQDEEMVRQDQEMVYLRSENSALKQDVAELRKYVASADQRWSSAEDHVRRCEEELAALRRGDTP